MALSEYEAKAVLAYARNNMNGTKAAKEIYSCNMDYILNKIWKSTGKNPRHFYELIELVQAANRTMRTKKRKDDSHD